MSVEEDKGDSVDGEEVLFSVADELEIDLQPNDIKSTSARTKRETRKIHDQSLQDLCHAKKRNELFTNKRNLKYIEGRQLCEDLTPLRHKLLKYMQKSCCDTFTSCYTRNGNIQ